MPFEWFVALRYLRDGKGQSVLILAAISVGIYESVPVGLRGLEAADQNAGRPV